MKSQTIKPRAQNLHKTKPQKPQNPNPETLIPKPKTPSNNEPEKPLQPRLQHAKDISCHGSPTEHNAAEDQRATCAVGIRVLQRFLYGLYRV